MAKKASSSRNHTIRLYREDETKWHCGVRSCLNTSTHECSFEFTSRSDRVATSRLPRCREHAQAFMQKNDAKYIKNEVADNTP